VNADQARAVIRYDDIMLLMLCVMVMLLLCMYVGGIG